MLTLSLFILLIYSSVIDKTGNLMTKNRSIIKIGILILVYSLYIMLDTSYDIFLNITNNNLIKDIYIYNDLYILNMYNAYIIALIYIVIISLLTINIIEMSSYNKTTTNNKLNISNINNLTELNNFNRYYITIILFNIIGIILFITSNNIMSIFIGIELQSYSLYILTGMPSKSQISGHNSLFYYLIGGFGSIIILYGLSLLYYTSGNIYLNNINILLDYLLFKDNLLIGWIFVLFGLLIKIGAGPLYNWSILLYMNSNTIITSYISIIPKISILSYLWYLYHNILLFNNNNISLLNIDNKLIFILSLFITLSLLLGSILGLTQIKIKSILGYSGLLNIGYLLLSILVNNTDSAVGFLIYISQYSLNHISIFLLLIIASLYNVYTPWGINNYTNHLTYIYELACIKNNIFLIISLCIIIGSFIGIPPLFGFYGKYYLLIGSINNNYIWLSILLIISSIIATIYYLYFLNIVIFNKEDKNNNNNKDNKLINNYNNNNIIPIVGNTLSYIFSSFIMIICFNFIQWNNILKGAYIIALNLI